MEATPTANPISIPTLPPCPSCQHGTPPSQRHWSWMDIDRSFKEQTAIMGDIHHWAWRANRPNESIHIDQRDAIKWVPGQQVELGEARVC
jgi:hypothetical protein